MKKSEKEEVLNLIFKAVPLKEQISAHMAGLEVIASLLEQGAIQNTQIENVSNWGDLIQKNLNSLVLELEQLVGSKSELPQLTTKTTEKSSSLIKWLTK